MQDPPKEDKNLSLFGYYFGIYKLIEEEQYPEYFLESTQLFSENPMTSPQSKQQNDENIA